MLPHIVRRIASDWRRVHCIHNLTTTRAFSMSSSSGSIRLSPASDTVPQQWHPRMDCSQPPITTSSERSEDMPSSQPSLLPLRFRLLMSLVILAGLAGCGPASSDNAPGQESHASGSRPPLSKQTPSPSNNSSTPATQAASRVPLLPGNETGAAAGMGTVQAVDNNGQGNGRPARPEGSSNIETAGRDTSPVPGIPESIAKALDSQDPRVRLQAMNHWEAQGTKAPLDPLFEALDDEDGYVRAKATEIIERYWAIEQERERK